MENKSDVVIRFQHVTKIYKLYKSDKQRFLALFLKKKIKCKVFKAIDDVSFEVHKGQSIGIVGKNGAGKSTLLKLITGVTFPTKGKIEVFGQVAALLELTAGFDMEMTGRENIYLKGYILGLSEQEIRKLEDKIIDFAEIGDFIDQPVRMYSSGMKARLGFAINANSNPDILVIDEALSVGDASFSAKCKNKVSEIIKQGATVLFVSHSTKAIQDFCTSAIYLKQGKIVASGTVDEIIKLYH